MAKAIMVQGTMSNAGKSLLAAGLCRIFKQDGYRVAPFKSQNMALNSFITKEGLEMGRAQVMQAEAAGIAPSVLMNPVLLKPTNDVGSQVIVNGEVLGNMSARDYFKYKKKLVPDIMKAYNALAAENDIIVIEGAGSPAEINLKSDDIVNMGMAKMAKAPVLLVGDIDRGGVFAQLIGTVMLLEEDEKEMVKGLIINKFRGDKTILDPGVEMLEERSGIPVVGVAPYLNIQVEDEDSLTERFETNRTVDLIDIAVIRVPRISNFTDFNPLESIQGVSLRYVKNPSELGNPDMIILPGTKNTMEDLLWMRENGLEAMILKEAAKGKLIFGICGGYQMMGETLSDPHGVEVGGTIKGMGLLPMDTVFAKKKTRTRVEGSFGQLTGAFAKLSDTALEGYEIHMGETALKGDAKPSTNIQDSVTGERKADGAYLDNVCGTYVHGVFDKEAVAEAIVQIIGEKKGLDVSGMTGMDFQAFKETQYDILKEAAKGKLIFGICGGYQMMGETLSDPHGVEVGGTIKGMGLLPMDTVFAKKKTRTRVEGSFGQLTGAFAKLSDTALEGYEIHMGETALKGDAKPSTNIQDSVTGERKADGAYLDNVCGTYVHGVFDKEAVAEAIVQIIGEKKGLDVSGMTGMDFQAFKETQYDILAAELRKHLDMKKIYEILEEGV